MDDLALIIRHCKRSRSTKLDLSDKGLSTIPQDVYQLTDLEILVLSNNKLSSIDPKISNLTKLQFLDVSGNQLTGLPQSISQINNLNVLNVSGNPLGPQFEALLKKENQSNMKLHSTLKQCFGGGITSTLDDDFPTFSSNKPLTLDRPFTTQAKPGWLDDQKGTKGFSSEKIWLYFSK